MAIDDGSRGQHLCRGPHGATGPQNPHEWNLTTVAGTGVAGYSGDGGPATAAELNQPAGVAIDAAGTLYIADSLNARIRKVGLNGIITTIAGTGTAGYSGEGGPAASAALSFPDRLYFDPQGNLFFIDDQRVPKITLVGNISLFAGNGVNLGCCLPETVPTGDGGPATPALLHQPSGIAFDTQGNVLIAEVYGHRIRRVYPDGIISTLVSNICTPDGLTLDPNGNLYTANNGCFEVTKIAPDGTQTVIAGSQGNTAQVCGDPLGDDGPAQFVAIEGGDVFWNAAGRLLVGDNYYEGGFLSGYVQTLRGSTGRCFPAVRFSGATARASALLSSLCSAFGVLDSGVYVMDTATAG